MPLAAALTPDHGVNLHSFALLLHILLLTYWLGADLGVYYSSKFVTDPTVQPAARAVAAKVMHAVDMGPRICLVLMLPSGVTLMALDDLGRKVFGGWPLVLVWVLSLIWLAMVIIDYRRQPLRYADLVHRLDIVIRSGLVVGLLSTSAYVAIADQPFGVTSNPKWLAGKVAAYAICIFGGLMIRVKLKPFAAAFAQLLTSGSTGEVEGQIRGSVRGCLPFVYLIWVMIVVAAFLGVTKPGSTAYSTHTSGAVGVAVVNVQR